MDGSESTRDVNHSSAGNLDALLRMDATRPEELLKALSAEGFEEYRNELIRGRRDHRPVGGIWQGLSRATGAVASLIWASSPERGGAVVFVDVDAPVGGEGTTAMAAWWTELDGAILDVLSNGRTVAPADIARRLGMSEDAIASLLALLAQEGKVRVCLVASRTRRAVVRTIDCPDRGAGFVVEFVEDAADGTRVAVNWCSAFSPSTAVTCARRCLSADAGPVAAVPV